MRLLGVRAFGFLLLLLAAARAEVVVVDSLEWMAADSPAIVRGKVTGFRSFKGIGDHIRHETTLEVEGVLKGEPGRKTLTVRLHSTGEQNPAAEWKNGGHSFLLFLRPGKPQDGKDLLGHWVPSRGHRSIIDLERPTNAYKADMTFARDASEILQIVHAYAGWKRPQPEGGRPLPQHLRLSIPGSSPILDSVYRGSGCYIDVPAEERHRAIAMALAASERANDRREGAEILATYPGPKTVEALTKLLDDPAVIELPGPDGELSRLAYYVRPTAYHSLLALGEKPEKPASERPPTPDEVRAYRHRFWQMIARDILGRECEVAVRDAEAPLGWTHTGGGPGLEVRCTTPKEALALFAMPLDWEGQNSLGNGEKLRKGAYSLPNAEAEKPATGARYLGSDEKRHLFCVLERVEKPEATAAAIQTRLARLRITNAYIASTGISTIRHSVSHRAAREFQAHGWVFAYHTSGDPKKPMMHQESVPVPQQELVAIWRAAMDMDQEVLRRRDTRGAGHPHQLEIVFAAEGRVVIIGWLPGEPPKDPKVARLLELVDQRHYGAW